MTTNEHKGSCMAYGCEGHHDGTCYLLMKVRQCISYLKDNPKSGDEKAAKYCQQSASNYNHRRAKIRSLQEDNFLPYPDVDPDVLIDCIGNAVLTEFENIHLQEWENMKEIDSTPTIRILTAYMNDGLQPDIQACSLLPCVMETTDYTCEPEDTPLRKIRRPRTS